MQSVLLVLLLLIIFVVELIRFTLSVWVCLCRFECTVVVFWFSVKYSGLLRFGWVLTRVSPCRVSRENPGIQWVTLPNCLARDSMSGLSFRVRRAMVSLETAVQSLQPCPSLRHRTQ